MILLLINLNYLHLNSLKANCIFVHVPVLTHENTGTIYQDFKIMQGYTEKEIVHKQRSLKGVLEPFSTAGNLGLLKRAGFEDITTVFQWVCFQGFFCIK